ncbi:chitin synthase-like [Gigantopelta aegis]|uniref:chitin synthase-like n=1 Tax=Gigantopelta aegis TaxID=1735272 RepID=UPI001B88BD2B|nr:chitin synthase-like [Gigantopelta aegis]
MCAPGCFSLYRASALKQVMDKYASPTWTPFTVYVKDTGEDRWMATLMMIHGWRLRFTAFADNTTYCPDTFEEFFKQRRRWILSDIANALLVVQNLYSLVKNNDCFTFVYVAYLLNMFVNNVITPGTAIVMITAGMELVFDVPYAYTTLPMALIVYAYAIACTRTSTQTQTILTSVMTIFMGSIFFSVAVWGSYKIVAAMVYESVGGHFRFQQHYVILMLTLSLVYAALAHPRECHEIVYGFAYLFIFPAMHVLLPIYSIANIIDQSWGTRDSNKAKIRKLICLPSFKKFRRKKKNKGTENDDENDVIKDAVASQIDEMVNGTAEEQSENDFWLHMRSTLIGNDVNTGLEKAALADGLRQMRNRSLTGLLIINALWLCLLSYFYMGVSSSLSRLNVYGVISGALYGFTLTIQVFGLTVCRINYLLRKLARCLYSDERTMWVCEKK